MVHLLPVEEPKSSPEMIAIILSILEAAREGSMDYLSVEYRCDGKINCYSVSQAVK